MKWKIDKRPQAKAAMKEGAEEGLRLAGEHVLNVSNSQVPHEEGDLERSGTVSDVDPADNTITIAYDTPYAVRQHEDLSYKHDAGRNAKYLENAVNSEKAVVGRIIGFSMQKKLGGVA